MEAHRGEVESMFTEEFDYDRAIEIAKEEAMEEGRIKTVKDMMVAGLTSLKAVRESGLYTDRELSLISAL